MVELLSSAAHVELLSSAAQAHERDLTDYSYSGVRVVPVRIAINGFGRIGRLTFRILMERKDEFEIVAVNDLTKNEMLATLLKYDSVHGRFNGTVKATDTHLIVNGKEILATSERDPAKLPWAANNVDIVIESTGIFTARSANGKAGYDTHLAAGAKKVVLSAPPKTEPI